MSFNPFNSFPVVPGSTTQAQVDSALSALRQASYLMTLGLSAYLVMHFIKLVELKQRMKKDSQWNALEEVKKWQEKG